MTVTKEIIDSYENYGRCVKISNGIIEAYITVDVGPRIIRFARKDGENVLYNDIARKSKRSGKEYDNYYYEGATWYLYGGHRLWITPESSPETYYPDNDEVKYQFTETGAVFTPPAQKGNLIQMQTEVIMSENSADMQVKHTVTNLRDTNRKFALWGVTVLGQGGLEIIPQNTHDTGLLPNRTVALWPYTDVTDERFYFGKDYITLRQDANAKCAFKIGTDDYSGFAAYSYKDSVFVCRYEPEHPDSEYPDNNVSFETYTDGTVLEMEMLSRIFDTAPGESAEFSMNWSLYGNPGEPDNRDEKAIKTFLNSLK